MSDSKKDNKIIDGYVSILDKISEYIGNLLMAKGMLNYITNNKGKIILIYLLIISLSTMYGLWDIGHCVNCRDIKPEDIPTHIDTPIELAEFYKNKQHIPYTTFTLYFKDLVIPLTVAIIQGILFISIFYIFYKLYKFITKKMYTFYLKKSK